MSRRFLDTIAVRPALKYCWLLTLSLSLSSRTAPAQETAEQPRPSAPASTENPSTETDIPAEFNTPGSPPPTQPWLAKEKTRSAAPDVYLLPDEFGKLRKVLGFRYEDFFEAWRRHEAAAIVAPPRYVLDAIEVTGSVHEPHARLRVELEISVQTTGWIDIPVQLPQFIVQQLKIEDQVAGECLVFDKQRHGHVVWLSGQGGKQRKLVLEGLAKIKLNTGSHGVELYLPRATIAQFSLQVPESNSRFTSSPELALTTETLEDGETEVRLLGQANPLRLNWTPVDENSSNQAALIEVAGETTVHLDRRRAAYQTTLEINSFERLLEQIQVRLPRGAKLKPGEAQGEYEIKASDVSSGPDQNQVVKIRRLQPDKKPWKLRLTAERPLDSFSDSAEYVVEGFEVLDAIQQSGTLTLEVDDQLQAYFDTHGDIDQTPSKASASAVEGRSVLGKFRYSRFPWTLVVFTSPRQRRVSVTPEYQLTINAEEARLDVQYLYELTGAQIASLRVMLHGWERTKAPIESGGLINRDLIVETRERLVLPLINPRTELVPLNLSFRKDLELGDNTFFLPEPLGAFVVDGELVVEAAESLRVTPNLDEMTGLGVLASSTENFTGNSTAAADPREEEPDQQLRFRTFLSQPKLVANVAIKQRQVTVAAQTTVDMDEQVVRVRQRLDYQSKYRPVSQLSLNLPSTMWSNESLSITLDGAELDVGLSTYQGVEPFDETETGFVAGDASTRQIIVSLPRPMQNAIPLEIAYEIPTPELATDELTPVMLPLAAPMDQVNRHEAVINAAPTLLLTANQRATSVEWRVTPESQRSNDAPAALQLQTEQSLSSLPMYVQLDSADKAQLATLERSWIQSWMTHRERQERAVFRFRTTHDTVFAQLPATFAGTDSDNTASDTASISETTTNLEAIEVLLDGEPWKYELLADHRLAILLPPAEQRGSHTLELRYQQPATLPTWGKLSSALPQLECRPASAPIYWQLILPSGWQVTTSPEQLIADYWLGWKNYRWGRQPTLSQADLEQITAAVSSPPPTPSSSQYVYRAFDLPTEIQVVVIQQTWLFVACALAAFGIGLLWLYTSLAQSGVFWLSLALTLCVGIFSYPEVTLLAIQTILAGGLMTFAAGVLRHVFTTRSDRSSANYPQETPTEVTESWQRQKLGERSDVAETTATLRTSEPAP